MTCCTAAAACLLALVATAAAAAPPAPAPVRKAAPPPAQTLRFGAFGAVTVYQPATPPVYAALFLSGDGGWNSGVVDMAKVLVAKDYLVIGIDVPRFLAAAGKSKQRCLYPPGDLQSLSQFVEKKLGIRRYLVPALVGYSSGATLAYAALAQAPAGTFTGAVSLGFCSDLEVRKVLCKGEGLVSTPLTRKGPKGYDLAPFKDLPAPWFALHGKADQVCDLTKTQAFVAATGNGHFVALAKVGHGFGVKKRWQLAFEQSLRDIAAAAFAQRPRAGVAAGGAAAGPASPGLADASLEDADLPLVEVPADSDAPPTPYLALLVSGDGGWAGLDREVAAGLADAGVPVVGLDSLQYFWSARTPDAAAVDVQKTLLHYLSSWQKTKIIAVGYSFGADVLPFFLSRLPPQLRQRLAQVVLISPSPKASFEFRVADWFGGEDDSVPTLPVRPEIAKLRGTPLLCFYGKEDHGALCPALAGAAQVVALNGSHRLADSWDELTATILASVGVKAPAN